jgi:hypothetical protein
VELWLGFRPRLAHLPQTDSCKVEQAAAGATTSRQRLVALARRAGGREGAAVVAVDRITDLPAGQVEKVAMDLL